MPTYVYECKECAKQTEMIQKITDPPLALCPACGGSVRKMIFPVGIVFKGSGFYVNDYKKNEGKPGHEESKTAVPPASSPENAAASASASTTVADST